jgi:hypothetical protein
MMPDIEIGFIQEDTIMNPFTQHAHQQGVSYIEHWFFAMGIAWRLLESVIAFALHAMFPFIDIERRLDLEATMNFLDERNRWIENAKRHSNRGVDPMFGRSPKWSGRQLFNICLRTFMLFV